MTGGRRRTLRPVADSPLRAVLYLRQSVSRDDSISLELQETACRDYCARRGYLVSEVIADPGISGRTWNRPGVQRTLDLIESGEADVIVLWRWSRLSRSRRDWAVAVDRVEVAGGLIESATEPVDVSTAAGRLQRGMLTELAAWESEVKGEQWREAQARRRSLGLPHNGGYRPGYVYEDKAYRPDPEMAPVVAEAYRRYVAGVGGVRISDWVQAMGLPCPTRGPGPTVRRWYDRALFRVLDSGWAAGLLRVHDPACNCRQARSCPRRVYIPGAHEPIIDEKLWKAFLRERERRTSTPRRLLTPSTSLSGLVRCGSCNYGMRVKQGARPARNSSQLYACAHPGCAEPTTVVIWRAEAAALEWLREYAHDVDRHAALAASDRAARTTAKSVTARAARAVSQLDAEMSKLTREFTRGVIPESAYIAARDELVAERQAADHVLEEAARQLGPARPSRAAAASLVATWGVIDVAGRNAVCRELLRVVVNRGPHRSVVTVVPVWEWTPPKPGS